MIVKKSYAERLKAARLKAGFSELFTAREIGCSLDQYPYIEAGLQRPSLKQRKLIENFIAETGVEVAL